MSAERIDLAAALNYDRATPVPHAPLPLLAEMMGALTDDGDTWTVPDGSGRSFRLSIEPDQDASVMGDGDWYGALEWVKPAPYSIRDAERPDGFDGRAVKIQAERGGDRLWWQPPADVTDPDALRKLRATIERLLEYGYVVVGLTYRETLTDSSGDPHTVDVETAYLGAVDEFYPEILAELVDECLPAPVAS